MHFPNHFPACARKRKPLAKDLLKAALAEPERLSRHAVAKYRDIILVLRHKNLSQVEIAEFLRRNSVRVHRAAVGRYLQQHPPTDAEIARVQQMLAPQAGAARSDAVALPFREELRRRPRKAKE